MPSDQQKRDKLEMVAAFIAAGFCANADRNAMHSPPDEIAEWSFDIAEALQAESIKRYGAEDQDE